MNSVTHMLKRALIAVLITVVSFTALFAQDEYLPDVDPVPVDANADDCVRRLKSFLADTYGRKIISGQMDLSWKDRVDMAERVFAETGKYPALMGYDFMNYKVTSGDGTRQVEEAIDWWNKGGIVAFCWHWRDPLRPAGYPEFYTEKTQFRIPYDAKTGRLDEKSAGFKGINRDLDTIAKQLKRLEDAGVPVLWRPLHEASGGWFWWGASGSDAYLALYRYMFSYLTKTKEIHNLLWVWNGQDQDWYPGDGYVDIIGDDIYAKSYETQATAFNQLWYMSEDPENNPKMIALTENGRIPNIDDCMNESIHWLYFMTWNDGNNEGNQDDNFWSGEKVNTLKHKKEVYASPYTLTLDQLPDLKTYEIRTLRAKKTLSYVLPECQ